MTVLRPAKVHGRWARNARTRPFVEAIAGGADRIELVAGDAVDQLTAAANAAALIEVVAARPGARILNTADPDAPTAAEIVTAIGDHLGWSGTVDLLDPGAVGEDDPDRGRNPWRSAHPLVLDTSAAVELGYRPVGTALDLLAEEVEWVRAGE